MGKPTFGSTILPRDPTSLFLSSFWRRNLNNPLFCCIITQEKYIQIDAHEEICAGNPSLPHEKEKAYIEVDIRDAKVHPNAL